MSYPSVLYWASQNCTQAPRVASKCQLKEKNDHPHGAGNNLPAAAQESFCILWSKDTLLVPVSVGIPQIFSRAYSAKLFLIWAHPSLYYCIRLFLASCRTSQFPFLSSMNLLLSNFSTLLRSFQTESWPFGILAIPHSFVSSGNLLRGTLCHIIWIINQNIEQNLTQYWPMGYTATYQTLTGLHVFDFKWTYLLMRIL